MASLQKEVKELRFENQMLVSVKKQDDVILQIRTKLLENLERNNEAFRIQCERICGGPDEGDGEVSFFRFYHYWWSRFQSLTVLIQMLHLQWNFQEWLPWTRWCKDSKRFIKCFGRKTVAMPRGRANFLWSRAGKLEKQGNSWPVVGNGEIPCRRKQKAFRYDVGSITSLRIWN